MPKEKRILDREEFAQVKQGDSTDGIILRKGAILQGAEPIGEDDDNEESRKLRFVISTGSPDRDNDVINADGWHVDDYLKNPVVLWAHDSYVPPVGKALTIEKAPNALLSDAEFMHRDLNAFSYMIYQMYKQKFMNAVSVGFQPIKWLYSEERNHGVDFEEQSLFEYSAVPVPANAEALQVARSKGIDTAPLREWAEKTLDEEGFSRLLVPKHVLEEVRKKADSKGTFKLFVGLKGENDNEFEITEEMQNEPEGDQSKGTTNSGAVMLSGDNAVQKRAISYNSAHSGGTGKSPEDTAWDGPGEVADAEVADLKIICTWVDEENPDIKGSYKLPHHKASGHDVVWNGVKAAMGALLGARGGADIPDNERRGVYNHLKKHYTEFDKEAPEFRFCEAEVLRTLPELFYFDYSSGELKETASFQSKKVTDSVTDDGGDAGSAEGDEITKEELAKMVGESVARQVKLSTGKLD